MYRRFLTISMVCLMAVLVLMVPKGADAQDKIAGPWLWMIAPTEAGQGGRASTDVDSLAAASGGAVAWCANCVWDINLPAFTRAAGERHIGMEEISLVKKSQAGSISIRSQQANSTRHANC